MKNIINLTFIFLSINLSAQIKRDYFFDNRLPVSDSVSLILIVDDYPQSNFASTLGSRIYSDTTFIKYLKEEWFDEYEVGHRVEHRCGYDMKFYALSNGEMIFLNNLNSACKTFQNDPKKLELLKFTGEPLQITRLDRVGIFANKQTLFTDNLVTSFVEGQVNWHHSRTAKFPPLYYNYQFNTTIKLDSTITFSKNMLNYLSSFTTNFSEINWTVPRTSFNEYKSKIDEFIARSTPCEIEVIFYITHDHKESFSSFELIPILYQLPKNKDLVLIYNKNK